MFCQVGNHRNLKRIGTGIIRYTQDNDENYPKTDCFLRNSTPS